MALLRKRAQPSLAGFGTSSCQTILLTREDPRQTQFLHLELPDLKTVSHLELFLFVTDQAVAFQNSSVRQSTTAPTVSL